MAKGKSTPARPESTARANRKPAASPARRPSAADKKAAPAEPRAFTGIEIGHVAGQVWAVLNDDGAQSLAAIKKAVDAPPDTVIAAIGWLARENKIDFATSGRSVKLSLR